MDAIVAGKVEEQYKVVSNVAGHGDSYYYLRYYNPNIDDNAYFFSNGLAKIVDKEDRIILFPIINFIYLINTTSQYLQFNLTLNNADVVQPFYLQAIRNYTTRYIDVYLKCGTPTASVNNYSTFVTSFDLVAPV